MADSEIKYVVEVGDDCRGTASPRMFQNTAANVARLHEAVEQSMGRKKYLARTYSPSDGSVIRWYYSKVPLRIDELAASVPRNEIIGKSDYFRFGLMDSLAIEASFLEREEELLSSWWKEYAECSKGPCVQCSSPDVQVSPLYEAEEERVGIPVKGGLYEVDLVKRHGFPVYWGGENRRVLRGHWFACKGTDWLPLREDVAEQLEHAYQRQVWHRRTFQPSGLFAARVDLQGANMGLYALFTGEDDTWEAWLNADASGFSNVISLGLGGKGIKLRRGYLSPSSPKVTKDELRQQKEEEMDDYCSKVPVRHLVFMVHGIGQRLEKSNLVDDVVNFGHITSSLAEKHLTLQQRNTQRVLFIPCQWRRDLKLSGESIVDMITLDGVRGLRVLLSATAHDVLYYMSPIYCQNIIDSVSNKLNRLYLKFLKRNPGYDGKVSIYGHSLGSVLSYDILCHQENLSSPFPLEYIHKEHSEIESSMGMSYQFPTGASSWTLTKNDPTASDLVDPMSTESVARKKPAHAHSGNIDPLISDSCAVTDTAVNRERENLFEAAKIERSTMDSHSDKIIDKECQDDINKNKEIDLLIREIDSLKVRMAELEAQGTNRKTSETKELLTESKTPSSSEALSPKPDDSPKCYTQYIKYTKLKFKVDTFFAVGSPLGVFLALRDIRIGIGKGQEYWREENITEEMPACRQLINLFHPFDPVAYRIEPLICKEYVSKRPVIVPYHKGGRRLHIGYQEFTKDLGARSQKVRDRLGSIKDKVLTVCQSKKASLQDMLEEAERSIMKEERSYGSLMIERLTGTDGGRVDYMLQDKTFEHSYIQAIGSHTNYWRDYDTALFILKHLYRDVCGDGPYMHDESSACSPSETADHSIEGLFAAKEP